MTFKTRKSRNLTRSTAIVAGAICAAIFSGSAAAHSGEVRQVFSSDPSKTIRQTGVDYSDLDLTTAQGAQSLLERIEGASEVVCARVGASAAYDEQRHFNECRAAAISDAVRTVHSPLLTSLAGASAANPPRDERAAEAASRSHRVLTP